MEIKKIRKVVYFGHVPLGRKYIYEVIQLIIQEKIKVHKKRGKKKISWAAEHPSMDWFCISGRLDQSSR